MNPSELSMMKGMVDILNRHLKEPFLTEEQYNMRLEDLKQFEEETNFAYINSPIRKNGVIIELREALKYDFKRCSNVENVKEFANNKEMLVYINLIGENVTIVYNNGVIDRLKIGNSIINLDNIKNIPYKINKKDTYIINGVLHNLDFYVTDIIDGGNLDLKDNLIEAKELGFNIIPYWFSTNLNQSALQYSIDYIIDYANEEEFKYDGIIFRFNDTSYSKDGIIYEVLK